MASDFASEIPSLQRDLLNSLLNRKVTKLIKDCLGNPEDYAVEWKLERKDVFSFAEGSIYMEFDGEIGVCFYSDPSINSVIISLVSEQNDDDPDYTTIDASNSIYADPLFREILGKKLIKYEIIKREPENSRYRDLPREVALVLKFENNLELIAAHQLHKHTSEDFALLRWNQVDKYVYKTLYKGSEFWD